MNPPGVILVDPKYPHNVAATIRACSCFGIKSLFWTGARVDPRQYERLPREERMKGYQDVAWVHTDRPFDYLESDRKNWHRRNFKVKAHPVCVEIHPDSIALPDFIHPPNAVYVFGPEDGGVPQVIRRHCWSFVHIPSRHCLNLAAAVNVVLYDRSIKLHPPMNVADYEARGEILVPGWDGK
jgi:tRNA(Leu) C34 or U34 (ribose-2'-O)-methylase TrmL